MTDREKKAFAEKTNYNIADLLTLMDELRAPEGCSWDRAQTHESIRRCLLEEAYEVAEAIDRGDSASLCEELGDLLFQIVFHAKIEAEQGQFDFHDVVDGICKKMVARHPHVFACPGSDAPDWTALKVQQRGQTKLSQRLEEIPKPLPALMRGEKLTERLGEAAEAFIPFGKQPLPNRSLDSILAGFVDDAADKAKHCEAAGDALLHFAAVCQDRGIDCEKALNDACKRIILQVKERESAES